MLLTELDKEFLNNYSPIPSGKAYYIDNIYQIENATKDATIIVPCYNSQDYLEKCLKSILQQNTRYDFEVIAINDGSTDETGEILRALEKKYKRLKVITQDNKGFSGARNTGIRTSSGKYLIFVDSDDYVTDGYIENLIGVALREDADIVACGFFSFYKEKKYKNVKAKNGNDRTLLNGCFWGKAFKRELFSHILLPEGYWYEDSILSHLIYPAIKKYCSIGPCQYAYRRNPQGITMASKGNPKSLDTLYITDLMINSVIEIFGKDYFYSDTYYEILIEQFYLNQRRLMDLPVEIQKMIFCKQAEFMIKHYEKFNTRNSGRKMYENSLKKMKFSCSILSIRLDKIYKIKDMLSK